jgi:WD40 repeat protein
LNTCPPPCCLPQTSEEYYACTWSLDVDSGAPLLLLAGKNGVLVVVNVATGSLETCFEGHGSSINDVAVHPAQPQFVATASRDHSLRLWNLRTRWVGGQPAGRGGARGAAPCLCADIALMRAAVCAAQAQMGCPPACSRRLLPCHPAGAAC